MNYTKDKGLGKKINEHLLSHKVESPLLFHENGGDEFEVIVEAFSVIMNCLKLDLKDDSIKETPRRIAKMYTNEIFYGLDYNNFPKCTTSNNRFRYNEMVTVKDIKSMSVCEHHFVTIDGLAKISYIPQDKILGLSKFNRVVDFFSRRPQVQERLTEQIYYALAYILDTEDIAVKIDATHFCVKSRGIGDQKSLTTTTKLGGRFKDPEVRNEFLNS